MPEILLLKAISPIDGRYRTRVDRLASYFSEYALIRYRVMVEIEYFIALCDIPLKQLESVDKSYFKKLRKIYEEFQLEDARKVKNIESHTNHDVKAVEYFVREKFVELGLEAYVEFIHFGLTSQDINNTAVPASLRDALNEVYYVELESLIIQLNKMAEKWKDISMLAKTHGQPASPTRLGKELLVFVERLKIQLNLLKNISISAKFGGATGNFNAHLAAYPHIDWHKFGDKFLSNYLKLDREQVTTQISNYDNLSAAFDGFKRINIILIDLCRDMWTYIMMEYFKQKIKKNEVGSSAMPHKVNPIDFENAEGNLGIANSLFEHLSSKLPISRLQRDLTDSTVLRNIGVPLAHSVLSIKSIKKGLEKLLINEEAIYQDLENNWAVVAEGIQTILRREGYPDPYGALKELTRKNTKISVESLVKFIDSLDIDNKIKDELKKLSPHTYTGINPL